MMGADYKHRIGRRSELGGNAVTGAGLSLRSEHIDALLSEDTGVCWLEVLVDNYLDDGGIHFDKLARITSRYPIVFHSVGFNLGSVDPLDGEHLLRVKKLCKKFKPAWISDHLAWTGANGRNLHDLLPLPRTREAMRHVVERLKIVRDVLELPILIENISRYVEVPNDGMTEWEFLAETVEAADIGILLDVNNACANAWNGCAGDVLSGFSILPRNRVRQMHLAGAERVQEVWIDTHGASVADEVWEVFRTAVSFFGAVPVCIERDNKIPPLVELLSERERAAAILSEASRLTYGP